jgi:hypothetical protein
MSFFKGCDQVLDLDFLSDPKNTGTPSSEKQSIHNTVQYDGKGNAVFSNDTSIVLWEFYQMELNSGFLLSVQVKPDTKQQDPMTLLSDGDCSSNRHLSIVIAFQTLEEKLVKVIFGLALEKKETMSYINVTTKVSFHIVLKTLHC